MIEAADIFLSSKKHGSDKHIHGYDLYYETIFSKLEPTSILEVGIKHGSSLMMWRELFPQSLVEGMDINKSFDEKLMRDNDINFYYMDSTSVEQKSLVVKKYDLIIDDGSHFYLDIMKTFLNLKDSFNHYYVIEDAMYNINEIVEFIKVCGYYNISVMDSYQHTDIPVGETFLKFNVNNKNEKTFINTCLKFIVIKK